MTQYASPGGMPALLRLPTDFSEGTVAERVNVTDFPGSTFVPPNRYSLDRLHLGEREREK